jgi:cellulose synthase/poly-beta-1,6-N-acetylglucosamine synthase-like glycosyltransferase
MATQVLDLDIAQLPTHLEGLQPYTQAFILFRSDGRPIMQALLPVVNGRLSLFELQDAINQTRNWPLWQQKVHNFLAWDESRVARQSLPLATVAVCTRDRPEDLRRCLEALMRLPDDGQEFLVIDNCPTTEETRQLVEEYHGRIRYLREDRPGLNVARNRALREAHHDIVAFQDDDAAPAPDWLRALLPNFADPSVLCVTGLTMPLELETEAQEWFERYSPFGRGFQRRLFYGSPAQALKAGHVGAGANMALRRRVLANPGPFDEALDAGTPTRSGGDTEMFARILAAGYHIVYDPAALSWHRHRHTWAALRQTAYGYGVGTYAVWTRRLLVDHQPGVLQAAWQHGRYYQLPMLVRAVLRRPGHMPLDLVLAELAGCLSGTWAYLTSRHRLAKQS